MREAPHTKYLGMCGFCLVIQAFMAPFHPLDSAPASCTIQAQGASFIWDIWELFSPYLGKLPGQLRCDFFQETYHV